MTIINFLQRDKSSHFFGIFFDPTSISRYLWGGRTFLHSG
jgi:hypothetical protein